MNNNKLATLVGIALVVIVAIAFGAYRLGVSHTPAAGKSPTEKIDPATGRKVLYWHDPMVPDKRFDKPGKSPFMDMQLVPVYADDAAIEGSVTIDPRVQQRLGVRLATVERSRLNTQVIASGTLEYNDRDVAVVQARANGFIEKLHARTPLQYVNVGDVLAELYVPDWVAAQEEYLAVLRMQSSARDSLLDAAKQRMRLAGMSDQQIGAIEASSQVQPRLQIRAPIAGVITELSAREGMTTNTGAALFRINGVDTLWLYAEIPEAQLPRVPVGSHVMATTTAWPNETLHGSVIAVLPEVSPQTRTAKARVEIDNKPKRGTRLLSAGMFVTATLSSQSNSEVLIVPSEAVIVTGTRTVVIVAEEAGRFRPVNVAVGTEANGVTEIVGGLSEGQHVVASAQFLIDSEASLKATTERMSGGSPSPQSSSVDGGGVREETRNSNVKDQSKQSSPSPLAGEEQGEGSAAQHDHGAHP